jgi:hypothetical protein
VLRLAVAQADEARALEVCNAMHEPAALSLFARSRLHPPTGDVVQDRHYACVHNPPAPYASLEEALRNWGVVDALAVAREPDGALVFSGTFDGKLGQQDLLLERLAPVLRDVRVDVTGAPRGVSCVWEVRDGAFSVTGPRGGARPLPSAFRYHRA